MLIITEKICKFLTFIFAKQMYKSSLTSMTLKHFACGETTSEPLCGTEDVQGQSPPLL